VECGVRSLVCVECRVWWSLSSLECGVWSAVCVDGVRSLECKVLSVESGV